MKILIFIMKVVALVLLLVGQHVCNATPLLELSHSDFLLDFSTSRTQHIKFDPEDGLKNREYFEKKYGQRGEELIATLGSGLPGVLILDQQQPLEHMKNEKSTIHNEVVTATSVPEMS